MGDRQAAAAVALADREGRRGDRLLDAQRAAGAADQGRLAGPDLAADHDHVARPQARGDAGAQRFGLGRGVALAAAPRQPNMSSWSAGGGESRARRRPRVRPRRSPRRSAAGAGGGPASRPGTVARSPRSVSFIAGVRRAAAGCSSGSRKTVRPPSSWTCGVPAHLGDPDRAAGQQLGREVAERADDLRLDQPHLLEQVGLAGLDLQRLRVAVAGRARLQHVGDEDLLAREPDLFQQLVQQLAGAADEGQALAVLFGPRRLADEHQLGIGVAGPEDRLGPGLVQGAFGAGGDLLVEGDQLLAALLGAGVISPSSSAGGGFRPAPASGATRRSGPGAPLRARPAAIRSSAPWPRAAAAPAARRSTSAAASAPEPHSAQGTSSAPAATSSSKRAPHSSHSNS